MQHDGEHRGQEGCLEEQRGQTHGGLLRSFHMDGMDCVPAIRLQAADSRKPYKSGERSRQSREQEGGSPAGEADAQRNEQINEDRSCGGRHGNLYAAFLILLFIQRFGHDPDEGRPEHGLEQAVQTPDRNDEPDVGKQADQKIAGAGGSQPGSNHFSGRKPVPQKAAEELADPVGQEASGHRKAHDAFAQRERILDFRKTGGIVHTRQITHKINQTAEEAECVPLPPGGKYTVHDGSLHSEEAAAGRRSSHENNLYQTFPFPFRSVHGSGQLRNGGGDIRDAGRLLHGTGSKIRTDADERNSHIAFLSGAVAALMAAVVCRKEDGIILLKTVHQKLRFFHGLPAGFQIFCSHPAEIVAGAVGEAEINESEIRRFLFQKGKRVFREHPVRLLIGKGASGGKKAVGKTGGTA